MKSCVIGEDALLSAIEEAVPCPDGVLATFSGTLRWETWDGFVSVLGSNSEELDVSRLLDVRAYDANSEIHAQRDALGKEFVVRSVRDDAYASDEMLDDVHMLDVDAKRSHGLLYASTGGGRYQLPIEDAAYVRIRNYLEYDEDGMATFVDFRIVGLERKGGRDEE